MFVPSLGLKCLQLQKLKTCKNKKRTKIDVQLKNKTQMDKKIYTTIKWYSLAKGTENIYFRNLEK